MHQSAVLRPPTGVFRSLAIRQVSNHLDRALKFTNTETVVKTMSVDGQPKVSGGPRLKETQVIARPCIRNVVIVVGLRDPSLIGKPRLASTYVSPRNHS